MSRLIININDGISDVKALKAVLAVVEEGKISGGFGKNREQYCYFTRFRDKTVACPTRYKRDKSDSFIVFKESKKLT